MSPFFLILGVLFGYSVFESIQILPEHPWLAGSLASLVFVGMMGSLFFLRSRHDEFEKKSFLIMSWVGSLLIGFWGMWIMFSLPLTVVSLFTSVPSSVHLAVLIVAFLASLLGYLEVVRGPKLVRVDAKFDGLAPELKGLKVAQISDLHVGPTIRRKYVERVVNKVNETEPDFIVVTGDLVDAKPIHVREHLAPLAGLKARHGTYYVTGNHEYYWDGPAVISAVKGLGMIPLINENRVVNVSGRDVMVAGVTDPVGAGLGQRPDTTKAFSGAKSGQFKIFLAHRPGAYVEAEPLGADLQFSGHTHAGQFFPFSLLIPFAHKYYRGLNRHGKMWVYVNPGTGYWGPANRFGIPSEVTLVTLDSER